MSNNENLNGAVYAKIAEELKRKTRIQSIILGIDYRDYIALALEHYSNHMENGEFNLQDELGASDE